MHRPVVAISVAGMLAACSLAAVAQAPKRPLTPDDWDHWRSISSPAISNDGRWVVYSLVPQVGDGELVVRSTSNATEYRVPRGFVGRPKMVAGARDTTNAAPPAQITSDNKFAFALTYAPMSEYDRARREKRRPADQPKASLAIVDLSNGQVTNVAVRGWPSVGSEAPEVLGSSVASSTRPGRAPRDAGRVRGARRISTASASDDAGRESIPSTSAASARLSAGTMARRTPRFASAASIGSRPGTRRTSPPRDNSPIRTPTS